MEFMHINEGQRQPQKIYLETHTIRFKSMFITTKTSILRMGSQSQLKIVKNNLRKKS